MIPERALEQTASWVLIVAFINDRETSWLLSTRGLSYWADGGVQRRGGDTDDGARILHPFPLSFPTKQTVVVGTRHTTNYQGNVNLYDMLRGGGGGCFFLLSEWHDNELD